MGVQRSGVGALGREDHPGDLLESLLLLFLETVDLVRTPVEVALGVAQFLVQGLFDTGNADPDRSKGCNTGKFSGGRACR